MGRVANPGAPPPSPQVHAMEDGIFARLSAVEKASGLVKSAVSRLGGFRATLRTQGDT